MGMSADSGSSWRPIGLRGTLVHSVAVSPTKPGVWIASTQSGIWRTGDDGNNWAPVGLAGRAIWAASWARDGVHAYAAGLGGDTVAISSDSGMSWAVSDVGLDGRAGYAVEPLDPGGRSLVLG